MKFRFLTHDDLKRRSLIRFSIIVILLLVLAILARFFFQHILTYRTLLDVSPKTDLKFVMYEGGVEQQHIVTAGSKLHQQLRKALGQRYWMYADINTYAHRFTINGDAGSVNFQRFATIVAKPISDRGNMQFRVLGANPEIKLRKLLKT